MLVAVEWICNFPVEYERKENHLGKTVNKSFDNSPTDLDGTWDIPFRSYRGVLWVEKF